MQQFFISNGVEISQNIKSIFDDHLSPLLSSGSRNAFKVETLVDLHGFIQLSLHYRNLFLPKAKIFGQILIKYDCPRLCDKARRILIPLSTSYLWGVGFWAVTVIESKGIEEKLTWKRKYVWCNFKI